MAQLDTAALFSILASNETLRTADAIVLLEGDGYQRVGHAVELFKAGWAPRLIISGGVDEPSKGNYHARDLAKVVEKEGVARDQIVLEAGSTNTREQAVEVLKLAAENDWRRLIIVASHYHIFRAFLTFLRAVKQRQMDLELYAAPVRPLSWFVNGSNRSRLDLLELEFQKIQQYKRDVATFEEGIEYLKWREARNTSAVR